MTTLLNIAIMNFEQLSAFVANATNHQKYMAKPSEASEIDLEICAEYVVNTVIMPALKNEHKRTDSRSLKVGKSDLKTAELIASAALTYWQNHGFIIAQNAKLNRAISAQIMEEERAEAKAEIQELLLDRIGVMIQAKPARFKHGIQSAMDWEETELVARRMMNYEGFACKHSTPAFVSF